MPTRFFAILLFLSSYSSAQDTSNASYSGKLVPIHSSATKIRINIDGRVCLINGSDRYYTYAPEKGWHYLSGKKDPGPFDNSWKDVHWITDSIGMISDNNANGVPVISRTIDKGHTYYTVYHHGKKRFFTVSAVSASGHIWLTGETGVLLFSADKGEAWETYQLPDDIEPASLSFYDDLHGLMASTTLRLYETNDGGRTWKKIKTPFQEIEVDRWGQGGIKLKIAVTKNYYITAYRKKLFYNDRRTGQWDSLDCVYSFDVDPFSGNIFLFSCKSTVSCLNHDLTKRWENSSKLDYPWEMKGYRDTLYFFDWMEGDFGYVTKDKTWWGSMYSLDDPIEAPFYKVTIGGKKWGMEDNEIFGYDERKDKWFRVATTPFTCWDISVYNDSSIFITDGGKNNQYIFNVYSKQWRLYKIDKPLTDFLKKPIRSFSVSKNPSGCFHFESRYVSYEKGKEGYFSTDKAIFTFGRMLDPIDSVASYYNNISEKELTDLLDGLNKSFWRIPAITDFGVNDLAIREYYKFYEQIVAKCRENKEVCHDFEIEGTWLYGLFNYMLRDSSFADPRRSLSLVNDSLVNASFDEGGSSTNVCDYTFAFINEDGEKMTISHWESDKGFYGPSWYNPWVVTIGNNYFTTSNLDLTRFYMKITPQGWMFSENVLNALFLFKIAYLLSDD